MLQDLLPGDWTTLVSAIIASCGVLISGVFSFLLYKATQQSTFAAQASAEAARASTRIAENLEKEREQMKKAVRKQLLIVLENQFTQIKTELLHLAKGFPTRYEILDEPLRVDPFSLAQYFDEIESTYINEIHEILEDLLYIHFDKAPNGLLKLSNEQQQDNTKLIEAIDNLASKMKYISAIKDFDAIPENE